MAPDLYEKNKNQVLLKTTQNELEQIKELLAEMRDKNRILNQEKQKAELKFKKMELKTKRFRTICSERERELEEKQRLINEMNNQKLGLIGHKPDSNEIKILQIQITKLKDQKQDIENNSTIKVKALENQIEELNSDRNKLSLMKEELFDKMGNYEKDVKNRNEALNLATVRFNTEKQQLIEELTRADVEIKEFSALKKLYLENSQFESRNNDQLDKISNQRNYELEINALKEQVKNLSTKLSISEVNLVYAKKEYQYLKSQIKDCQREFESLKHELAKTKPRNKMLNLDNRSSDKMNNNLKNEVDMLKKNFDHILSKLSVEDQQNPHLSIKKINSTDQTIDNLNKYLIKNIVSYETNEKNLTDIRLANVPNQFVILRNQNMYHNIYSTRDIRQKVSDRNFYCKCLRKRPAYIDSLKSDLFRRIELEVNKEIPLSGVDFSSRRFI